MSKHVSFLLLAGGVGSRSGHHEPKQFRFLTDFEMIARSLTVANAHPDISEIITNAPEGYGERTKALCKAYAPGKPARVLPCGRTRQESVKIMLDAASHDIVILHEAARPMIDREMIDGLLQAACENAGYFAPIPFSMCEIDPTSGQVGNNVPREKVYNIQLPQKFSRKTLREAHLVALQNGMEFNEDAVMVSTLTGSNVMALRGHAKNIKVTTPEDFEVAIRFLEQEKMQ